MYKTIFIIILMLCSSNVTYAETSQDRYIRRIDEEIKHNQRMKELKLQHEIYCNELELQKDNVIVDNSNKNYTHQTLRKK